MTKLNELDSINYLIDRRNEIITHLSDVLMMNDSMTQTKSVELLGDILNINSQIKLEEDLLVINRLFKTSNVTKIILNNIK